MEGEKKKKLSQDEVEVIEELEEIFTEEEKESVDPRFFSRRFDLFLEAKDENAEVSVYSTHCGPVFNELVKDKLAKPGYCVDISGMKVTVKEIEEPQFCFFEFPSDPELQFELWVKDQSLIKDPSEMLCFVAIRQIEKKNPTRALYLLNMALHKNASLSVDVGNKIRYQIARCYNCMKLHANAKAILRQLYDYGPAKNSLNIIEEKGF